MVYFDHKSELSSDHVLLKANISMATLRELLQLGESGISLRQIGKDSERAASIRQVWNFAQADWQASSHLFSGLVPHIYCL